MTVQPVKLGVRGGGVVEIEGRRYDVVPVRQGGLTAVTEGVDELREWRRERAATQEEIDDELDLLPADGEG